MIKPVLLSLSLFYITLLPARQYHLEKLTVPVSAHFRAVSVVDDQVVWLAGTGGKVGRSIDGGKTWEFSTVAGFDDPKADFRTLYAFDEQRALIANVGSPAKVLLTTDGGKNWSTVYTNTDPEAFLDGIDFWNNKEGLIYGDPINGRMLLLHTLDGGLTWNEITTAPLLEKGEASFAASGTGLRCLPQHKIMIATGGIVSHLWSSEDQGKTWKSFSVPILQGGNMTGIFSFAQNKKTLHIVGGEYNKEEPTTVHHYYSIDNGVTWLKSSPTVSGFRECVEPISEKMIITAGPTGANISNDNGHTWTNLSTAKGLHVARKARKGSLVIAAGSEGSVYKLVKVP